MAETKLYAVSGRPILHSKSPDMFNALFSAKKIPSVYTRISSQSAEEALFLFKELGMSGMNITAPLKQVLLEHLSDFDSASEQIGGVNAVLRTGDALKGYNTDHVGVVDSLKTRSIPIQKRRCLVLGAGAAGRAAAYGLLQNGAEVFLVNRTYARAQAAAKILGCQACPWEDLKATLDMAHILVSAISAPENPVKAEWLNSSLVVFDAKYPHSQLYDEAAKQGCTVIRGEEWLLNQAIPVFTLFTGQEPEESLMRKALASKTTLAEKPKNIALVGFMGCGKTTIGKRLAARLDYEFQDTDSLIEKQEGRSIPDIFHSGGEAYFRRVEKRGIRGLAERQGNIWACGGGSVLDTDNRKFLKDNALVIWLYTSLATSFRRIEPGTRPLLDGEASKKAAEDLLRARLPFYAMASDLVLSSEGAAEDIVENIYAEIG